MKARLLICLALLAVAATPEEINRAVKQLGAPDFKTRDAATQLLTEAGKAAVPALEKAAQSPDPEIRLRAKELLPSLRLGLPKDFPADLREEVNEYAGSSRSGKSEIVAHLLATGKQMRPVVIGLLESEKSLEARAEIAGPALETIADRLATFFREDALDTNTLSGVLEDLDFYQSILPEEPILPLEAIKRLSAAGDRNDANIVFDRSFQALEKLCAKDPGSAEAHNNLAWLCAISRRRLDDGLKHIEKALNVAPKQPAFLDTQAELYFQKGDRDKALALIARCIELDPDTVYFQQQQERIKKGDKSEPPPELEAP